MLPLFTVGAGIKAFKCMYNRQSKSTIYKTHVYDITFHGRMFCSE